ncbi:hypothetical protein AWZ03_014630 [Drosophila navojoa]|uniref:Death domain-containing protein n=1 Tax=Drosophila navojoa TaxID=7232 RepID=A0A484ARH6_DRONA|nr:hypothetical protein AWZ03_014630 [Drosophila navojoa]
MFCRFLVSFLVDARGGSMRGCRHSGVRIIVPPKACSEPTRITCRYVKPQRVANPPPLMEGEALVSRILEMSPVEGKFLSPIVLEVPHFGSLRGKEREIIILRSDNGESWREHSVYEDESNLLEALKESMAVDVNPLEDLHTSRIIRIVTRNVPHFFAVVSRVRQEVHAIGPDGGTVSSIAVPQVQSIFPPHALTKKIRVGLQAQPVDLIGCSKLLGQGVAVSPVVTVEPRRRKFHKAITLSIPAPTTCNQGMVNTPYNATNGNVNAPTLRLLCSITGGQSRAVWEDVTGSTPLAFVKDSVSFTTTVSARFWLMDCRNIADAGRMATELYTYMAQVPFMRADIRLSDISNLLGSDWPRLAEELDVPEADINLVKTEYADQPVAQQGLVMLRLWLKQEDNHATGNAMSQALNKIGREDIVEKCIFNLELVTDQLERGLATARMQHDHTLMENLADGLNETLNIEQQSNEEELCQSNEQSNNDKCCSTPPSTPIEINVDPQEYQNNISTSIPEMMQKIIEQPRVNEVESDFTKREKNEKDSEKIPQPSEGKLLQTLAEKY